MLNSSFNKISLQFRISRIFSCQLPILTLISIVLVCSSCGDRVTLINNSTEETGLLIDASDGAINFSDRNFKLVGNPIPVGDLRLSGSSNEVVAFTNQRPVSILTNVPWTSSDDNISVEFKNKMRLAVKVWIISGPFTASKTTAVNACITTSNIWNSERMGIDFSTFEVVDATGDPEASNYFDFTCSMQAGIKNDIGFTPGRINIYYVRTVDGGADRGQACQIGSNFIAIATGSGSELLSHEIGHCFALQHVDGDSNFDQTNIMHPASSIRRFITEGQLFRIHLRSNSAVNFVYSARPGLLIRDCDHSTNTSACPVIQKRIWADGTFPPN